MSYPESPGGSSPWTDNKIILGVLGLVLVVTLVSVQGQVDVTPDNLKDTMFSRLISVRGDLTFGEAVFEYYCPFDYGCKIGQDLTARFIRPASSNPVLRYEHFLASQIEEPRYVQVWIEKTCQEIDNKTLGYIDYNCSRYEYREQGTTLKTVWNQISPSLILNKGKHSVKIRAYWKARLGPQSIDWVPQLSMDKADYPELQNSVILEKKEWAWFNVSFLNKTLIYVNQSGSSDLYHFPAYIEFDTEDRVGKGEMQADCDDFRIVNSAEDSALEWYFINASSTKQIGCNQNSTGIMINITIPTSNTTIYIYYNSASAVSGESGTTDVWDGNIIGAWHHDSATGSAVYDFGTTTHNGTISSAQWNTNGVIGYNLFFDGISDAYSIPDHADWDTNVFTWEGWVNRDGNCIDDFPGIWSKGFNQYFLSCIKTTNVVQGYVWQNPFKTVAGPTLTLYQLYHVAWTYNNSDHCIWIDGDLYNCESLSGVITTDNNPVEVGRYSTHDFPGYLDEITFSNSYRGPDWIKRRYQYDLFSEGQSEAYSPGAGVIIVTVNDPINQTYNTSSIDINVTTDVAADTCIYSMDSGSNITLSSWNSTYWYGELTGLSEITHDISVFCNESLGGYDIDQVYFTVDTTAPTITIHLPDNTTYTSTPTDLKVSASETISAWWYSLNGAANDSFSPNTTISINSGLNYIWVYANDSAANIGSQGPVWFTFFNYTAESTTYEANVIEGSTQNFQMFLNFSDIDQVSGVSGNFYYNGSSSSATATLSGTGYNFNSSIDIGHVNISCCEKQDNEFFWNFTFTYDLGSENNQTQNESQLSHRIMLTNCTNTSLTNTKTLYFNIYDEENGSVVICDMEIAFDPVFYTGDPSRNYSWADLSKNAYPVCIYPSWAEYTVDSMSQFEKEGAAFKNYYLDNATLNNVSQNISVYLGSNETATLIQMEVLDHLGMPKPYVVITAQRYFIGENVYRTTGVFKADFQGEASGYLIKNTVWYRFVITEEGTVLASYDPMTINADEITFRLSAEGLGEWFQYYNGIGYNCTTSTSTNSTTCTVTDATGLMVNASLIVREYAALGWLEICEDYSEASASTLVCPLGATQNRLYYYILSAEFGDSEYELEAEWLDYRAGVSQWGTTGLLIALILTIFLVFVGAWNPKIGMVMAGVGMGLSYGFGLLYISYGSLIALFIVIGVAVYVMRG